MPLDSERELIGLNAQMYSDRVQKDLLTGVLG